MAMLAEEGELYFDLHTKGQRLFDPQERRRVGLDRVRRGRLRGLRALVRVLATADATCANRAHAAKKVSEAVGRSLYPAIT